MDSFIGLLIALYIIGAVLAYGLFNGLFKGISYKKYLDSKWNKERIIMLIIISALSWLGFIMLLLISRSEKIPISLRFRTPKNS